MIIYYYQASDGKQYACDPAVQGLLTRLTSRQHLNATTRGLITELSRGEVTWICNVVMPRDPDTAGVPDHGAPPRGPEDPH